MSTETSKARGEVVAVPREVIDFLMGEGELQGAWFGETPTGERGQWFWRKHLRRELNAAPPPAAARGDVLTAPGGGSFPGWAAWLRDRGGSFDPYVQGPMFEQLARWMESLPEAALAAEGVQAWEVE